MMIMMTIMISFIVLHHWKLKTKNGLCYSCFCYLFFCLRFSYLKVGTFV